jgi:hypothetical protein
MGVTPTVAADGKLRGSLVAAARDTIPEGTNSCRTVHCLAALLYSEQEPQVPGRGPWSIMFNTALGKSCICFSPRWRSVVSSAAFSPVMPMGRMK